MEIDTPPARVFPCYTCAFQIDPKPVFIFRYSIRHHKDAFVNAHPAPLREYSDKVVVHGNMRGLAVLCGRGTDTDKRLFFFKPDIAPFQRLNFATAQARIKRKRIRSATLERGDGKQGAGFRNGQGATLKALATSGGNMLHGIKRWQLDPFRLLNPIQKGLNRVLIFIKRFHGGFLNRSPLAEAVTAHVAQTHPAARLAERKHAGRNVARVVRCPAQPFQFADECVKQIGKGSVQAIAFRFRHAEPFPVAFGLLYDAAKFLLRNLLIGHAEIDGCIIGVPGELVTSAVNAIHSDLAAFCAFPLENVFGHAHPSRR